MNAREARKRTVCLEVGLGANEVGFIAGSLNAKQRRGLAWDGREGQPGGSCGKVEIRMCRRVSVRK